MDGTENELGLPGELSGVELGWAAQRWKKISTKNAARQEEGGRLEKACFWTHHHANTNQLQ
jgi:hypothetical protein